MSNIWERFEGIANKDEVQEAKSQFAPLFAGDYKAMLEEITPSESRTGLPMIKGKFRTVEGNKVIFYNQTLQNLSNPQMTAINIAEAVTFVGGLLGEDIEFNGLGALAELIGTIPVGVEYMVNVSYRNNDLEMKFPKLKIISKADTPYMDAEVYVPSDEDLPFN